MGRTREFLPPIQLEMTCSQRLRVFIQLAFTPEQMEPLVAAVQSWLATRGPDESMFMYIACLPPTFAVRFRRSAPPVRVF